MIQHQILISMNIPNGPILINSYTVSLDVNVGYHCKSVNMCTTTVTSVIPYDV